MGRKGSPQKQSMTKIEPRAARVSPDDVKYKLDQLARLSATDTRSEIAPADS
jgi:hypothetical protein